MEKVSKMMDETQFWDLVAQSLQNSDSQEGQKAYLIAELMKLSNEEIIGFHLRTDYLLQHTYTSKMWCAADITKFGCSDDVFLYFRLWVISRGKEVYEKTRVNPDSLISTYDEDRGDDYNFEGFGDLALIAFDNKNDEDIEDYIVYDNFLTDEIKYPRIEFNWRRETEIMQAICPQLFAKFCN